MTDGNVETIRVSTGSAIVLGLARGLLKASPTTIYLLTYRSGRCTANCGFCAQARSSRTRSDMLSRVIWPPFPLSKVKEKIASAYSEGKIKRVCIQTLNYRNVLEDLLYIVKELKSESQIPVSISCQPLKRETMEYLFKIGVDRIEVSLDAATKDLFERVKGSKVNGPYRWERQLEALSDAIEIFGKGRVTTHLIVGLGETERKMVEIVQWCVDKGILPALFAFTPIPGTMLEGLTQPPIESYRRIQIARYLILKKAIRFEDIEFDENGEIKCFSLPKKRMREILVSGGPFMTSGCPGCNRPFYNEKVTGPIYNVPSIDVWEEIKERELERLERIIHPCFNVEPVE